MKLYHIKMWLKRNKLIKGIYDKVLGDRKAQQEHEEKRKALQETGLDMLRAVEEALGKTNARFYLEYGSLLGMVRDGHFIGHDDDIDFAVYIDESFTWEDLETALTKAGMKKLKQFVFRGECTEQTYQMGKLTADFFRHIEEENCGYSFCYHRQEGYIYNSPYEHHAHATIGYKIPGITTMQVGDLEFHIPMEADKYLASIYGEDWRIPNPNWANGTSPEVRWFGDDDLAILQYT